MYKHHQKPIIDWTRQRISLTIYENSSYVTSFSLKADARATENSILGFRMPWEYRAQYIAIRCHRLADGISINS